MTFREFTLSVRLLKFGNMPLPRLSVHLVSALPLMAFESYQGSIYMPRQWRRPGCDEDGRLGMPLFFSGCVGRKGESEGVALTDFAPNLLNALTFVHPRGIWGHNCSGEHFPSPENATTGSFTGS